VSPKKVAQEMGIEISPRLRSPSSPSQGKRMENWKPSVTGSEKMDDSIRAAMSLNPSMNPVTGKIEFVKKPAHTLFENVILVFSTNCFFVRTLY